jgi:hypothetical protein
MSDTLPFSQRDYVQSVVLATAAQWAGTGSYVLPQYAMGLETDTFKAKFGDGSTPWSGLSYWNPSGGSGTGDVVGPASAVAGNVALFNGVTGKLIKDGLMALPASSGTLGYLNVPQNAQTGNYTAVLTDSGKDIYHALGAGAGDTYTIPANASVAYPVGTIISFSNDAVDNLSLVITSDVINYMNVGPVTTVTIPQFNKVVAEKKTSTTWLLSGSAGVTTA